MTEIEKLFPKDLTDYAPIPFWSWNNGLERGELIRQIGEMKAAGMGGFIMHARTGLTTPYLGKEWFELIEACLDEAKRLGMNAWIYDENGWPSGFTGGELLKDEDNLATYLEREEGAYDPAAYASFLCEKGHFLRIHAPAEGKVFNVYVRRSPANTDILKPSVVDKFIRSTYEEYYKRFAPRFGKELKGFFTDEPQYFRWGTPFSVSVEEYFQSRYGEDVRDGVCHLFTQDEEGYPFRVKYYNALNYLYTNNYYKRIYDWCTERGCMFTGHSVEESAHYTQMWGCAGCMPSYEMESIPGIDNLARNGDAKLSARQVGSVAAQLGKKQVLTETFGCSGYNTDPRMLRSIAEKQYVHGVNLMCHHLYAYSLAGQGKTDHPPCFSRHKTWNGDFAAFNAYFTRLGYLLANTRADVRVAVLSPMTGVYLKYRRFDEAASQIIDEKFDKLAETLAARSIEYHIIDERILAAHGRVEGKTLVVGDCRYDGVILPFNPNIMASSLKILQDFTAGGGRLAAFDGLPKYLEGVPADIALTPNTDLDGMERLAPSPVKAAGMDFTHRVAEGLDFVFVYNRLSSAAPVFYGEEYSAVDLVNLTARELRSGEMLGAGKSLLLVKNVRGAQKVPYFSQNKDITDKFSFVSAGDNCLTVDFVEVSRDGKTYSKPQYVYELFDALVRENFDGELYVRYAFEASAALPARIMKEADRGEDFRLNGHPLEFGGTAFDVKFAEADITPYIRVGRNEFTYRIHYFQSPMVRYALFDPAATESVRNCLTFDTEIEQIYVLGQFSVNKRTICPLFAPSLADMTGTGMPHFASWAYFKAEITSAGGTARLTLGGDYMAAALTVNGKTYPVTLDESVEITLAAGRNELVLGIAPGLRNMIGPLHFNGDESAVGPFNFRMTGAYGQGSPFDPGYRLAPFGVKVLLADAVSHV